MNIIEQTIYTNITSKIRDFDHLDRLYPTYASAYITYKNYKKLYGKCQRAAYYSCNGIKEKEDISIELELQKKLGLYIENMIIDIFNEQNILISKGLKFELPQYKIYGKLDAIILENGLPIGVEIKTIGGSQYNINTIFSSNGFPKWKNLFQTLIYLYAFRGIIDKFYILYIRRDNCDRKIFTISIEPIKNKIYPVIDGKVDYRFTVNELLERYMKLDSFITSMVVPIREYVDIYPKELIENLYKLGSISKYKYDKYLNEPFGDSECCFCGYKDKCKEDNNGNI